MARKSLVFSVNLIVILSAMILAVMSLRKSKIPIFLSISTLLLCILTGVVNSVYLKRAIDKTTCDC